MPRQCADGLEAGTVVENVIPNFEAERAGVKAGDGFLRWRRGEAQGEIASPFDLAEVEITQAVRGPVTIEGIRDGEKKSWTLGVDSWGVEVRPKFSQSLFILYERSRQLVSAGDWRQAEEGGRELASCGQNLDVPWLQSWLGLQLAGWSAKARQWEKSDEAFQESLQSGSKGGVQVQAQLLRAWAKTFQRRSLWAEAEKHLQQVLANDAESGEGELARAMDLEHLGQIADSRGDLSQAQDYYQQSLNIRTKLIPGSLAVAASLNDLAKVADDRYELVRAQDYARQALLIAEKLAPGSLTAATSLRNLALVAYDHGELFKAEEYQRQSLAIRQKLVPGSLEVAATLTSLGTLNYVQDHLDKAEEYYRESLAIRQQLAPGSLDVAASLTGLGGIANRKGELAKAVEYQKDALAIRRQLAPDSLDVAISLTSLGILSWSLSDLTVAERYLNEALAIQQRLTPNGLDVALSFHTLGSVAVDRGAFAQAEEYYKRALVIRQKLAPDSMLTTGSLTSLGEVFWSRGELAKAGNYFRRALAIQQKISLNHLLAARIYEDLGIVAQAEGDLAGAERYETLALSIRQKIAPKGFSVSSSFMYLGLLALQQGNTALAESHCRQALEIAEEIEPLGVNAAQNRNCLGAAAQKRGDLDSAEQNYRRALEVWERLAPASDDAAESLAGLAFIMIKRGQMDAAAQFFERALNALEGQMAVFGGAAEVRAGFRAKYENYYRDYIALAISQNKPEVALTVLERSRARTLLETLTAAHVDTRKGADPDLVDRERLLESDIRAKSQRRITLLAAKHNEEQITAVEKEISDLTSEYQDIGAQIHSQSAAYAGLAQLQPLNAGNIQQQVLDPETLLLEYALGEERSYVFVVSPASLEVVELPKRAVIEDAARRLYGFLTARNLQLRNETQSARAKRLAEAEAGYNKTATQLSRIVLEPLAEKIAGKRLLIVSDGALHYVPYSALPVALPGKSPVPLMAEHEVINLPSASVLAGLRQQRRQRTSSAKTVAVFADPVFDAGDVRVKPVSAGKWRRSSDTAKERNQGQIPEQPRSFARLTRSAKDLGWNKKRGGELYLPRLRFSRAEADQIAAVVPAGESFKALDFRASRTIATSPELANYRIVHFATHALLDNKQPELSGLVLSLVDQYGRPQDGFLDIQDIYNLNLPAELVVLSTCESALGKRIEGEGLIGLTRGFMYAGASRVMASLWSIDDQATAEFMRRFYQAMLAEGMPPSAALRAAQVGMWKEKRWNSPYFWAPFQLQGEWR